MDGFEGIERLSREIEGIAQTTPAEERKLARRIAAGDGRALNRLVEGNLHAILPIARALAAKRDGRWDAVDLMNEAVVAVTKGAREWRPIGGRAFAVYARVRARGAMKDFLRRRADVVRGGEEAGRAVSLDAGERPEIESWAEDRAETDRLAEALAALPRQEREVLGMRVFTDRPIPVERCAQKLGVRPVTVLRRQSRGLETLLAIAYSDAVAG